MISIHDMTGKFPGKTHTCAHKNKWVMRDSEGWGWVRMGAGGCIDTHQTQKKVKIVIGWCARHNCEQTCWGGGNGHKDVVATHEHHRACRGVLEARRVRQASHMHLLIAQTKSARETTRKKRKQANSQLLKKSPKTRQRENNRKIAKKKEKEAKRQNKKHSKRAKLLQAKGQQRSGETEQKTVCNGNCC